MPDEQGAPNEPGPPAPAPAQWNPAVTWLMIALGIPLLLPGVCSFLFARAGEGGMIAALGFLISFGGIAMIVFGVRRLRSKDTAVPETAASENTKLSFLIVLLVIFILLGLLAVPLFKH
jgi:predicted phage tail protein